MGSENNFGKISQSAPLKNGKISQSGVCVFGKIAQFGVFLYLCTEEIKSSNLYAMKAKPFIKWVGGESQLIEQLEAKLPADFDNWENVTYIIKV